MRKAVTKWASFLTKVDFETNEGVLDSFSRLDDYDILSAIKVWQEQEDFILAKLAKGLVNRRLFKIEISKTPFSEERIAYEKQVCASTFGLSLEDVGYFVYQDVLINKAYNQDKQNIHLLMKNGQIVDLEEASDNLNISALAQPVEKYFLCYPLS